MATRMVVRPERRSTLTRWVESAPLSKPRLASAILLATVLTVAVALAAWQLLLLHPRRGKALEVWYFDLGGAPGSSHARDDAQALAQATRGQPEAVVPSKFVEKLGERLRKLDHDGASSLVLYVTGPIVAGHEGRHDHVPLGRREEVHKQLEKTLGPDAGFSVDDLLQECRRHPRIKKLLIWDAGQVGSDRDLGVFGDPFVFKLQKALADHPANAKTANLAVLVSCAPGQVSWRHDGARTSIFAHFVQRGLTGGVSASNPKVRGLSAQTLAHFVQNHVRQWVEQHRGGARQTPLLVSDLPPGEFDLPMPVLVAKAAASAAPQAKPAESGEGADGKGDTKPGEGPLIALWRQAWTRFAQERGPGGLLHRDPRAWHEALLHLRQAERAYLEGCLDDMERPLRMVERAEWTNRWTPVSLAELRGEEYKRYDTLLDQAYDELVGAKGLDEQGKPPAVDPAKPDPEGKPLPKVERGDMPEGRALLASKAEVRPSPEKLREGLIDEAKHPRFLEYQLPLWAWVFTNKAPLAPDRFGPDPQAFEGERGPLLLKALDVRKTAERVAALDPRVLPWTLPLLDEGDRKRRLAQDRLFTADERKGREARGDLELAEEDYKNAGLVGAVVGEAYLLLDEVLAASPGLAVWLHLREAPTREGDHRALMAQARELAKVLLAGPGSQPRERTSQLGEVRGRLQSLRSSWGKLQARARLEAETSKARWRELDALLAVPFLAVDDREKVLKALKAAEGHLDATADLVVTADAPAALVEYQTDPSFWTIAAGLAQAEIDMIALAPMLEASDHDELARQELAIGKPAASAKEEERFRDMAQASAEVRDARRKRLERLHKGPSRVADLPLFDLAARVLPTADLERFRGAWPMDLLRQEWLAWQVERLAEDNAIEHARAVLVEAERLSPRSSSAPERLRALSERLDRGERALALLDPPTTSLKLDADTDKLPLPLAAREESPLPPGEASFFVSANTSLPIQITAPQEGQGQPWDLRQGALVEVGHSGRSHTLPAEVTRDGTSNAGFDTSLRIGVFYRGQVWPKAPRGLALAVGARKALQVLVQQRHAEYLRVYGDQFLRHPNRGFLHPGSTLECLVAIDHPYDKDTKVVVRHGFDPGKFEEKRITLKKGVVNREIMFDVSADKDLEGPNEPRDYQIQIGPDTGRPARPGDLLTFQVPFQVVSPERIVVVQQKAYDVERNVAFVIVRHLENDPVSGPARTRVTIGGNTPGEWFIGRGEKQQWWVQYPPGVQLPPKLPVVVDVGTSTKAIQEVILTGPEAAAPPGGGAPASPGTAAAAPP